MQVAVIGLGTFGRSVATSLTQLGAEVIAIDRDESLVESIKDKVAQAIIADATDELTLRSIGIPEVDAAVIAIGEMSASILATLLLRRLGLSRIIVRSLDDNHSIVLEEVGASRVIPVEKQMGQQIARTLIAPHIMDRKQFAEGFSLVEIRTPHSLVGLTIKEAKLRERHQLNLVALQRRVTEVNEEGKSVIKTVINSVPQADEKMEEGHVLILAGSDHDIDVFLEGGVE